jgi:hypothetical protein
MKTTYFITMSAFCLLQACASDPKGTDGFLPGDGDSGGEDTGVVDNVTYGEIVLSPRDKAKDLVLDGENLFYSTQYDPAIVAWDIAAGTEENVAWDYRDLEAFTVSDGRFWGSFSDSGIEGWVSEILPPKSETEWAYQATDGTLFRRPADLIFHQNHLYVVDLKASQVWKVSEANGAESVAEADGLLCLAVADGEVFFGGEAGVFSLNGTLVDERPVLALGLKGGELYGIHPTSGFFAIGTNKQWELAGPPRPGSFVWYNESLYAVDEVGGSIWRFDFTD